MLRFAVRLHCRASQRPATKRWGSVSYSTSTVDPEEIRKFSELSNQWWDLKGPLRTLHHINPTRIMYIKKMIEQKFAISKNSPRPLEGLKILDIGCGAGILTEPLSRLGGTVVGIDASLSNIKAAEMHQSNDPILKQDSSLQYQCTTSEDLAKKGFQFDVVCALEVVEHVANVENFTLTATQLVKPSGLLFMSTINRTNKSYALAVIGAEYVLGLLERGTHEWDKFVTPEELEEVLLRGGMRLENLAGLQYNPISRSASISKDVSVNYILCASKASAEENETI